MDCEEIITLNPEGEETLNLNPEGDESLDLYDDCLCAAPFEDRDYNKSFNKPQINGVELIGDKSSAEIHVQHEMDRITEQKIDDIIYA